MSGVAVFMDPSNYDGAVNRHGQRVLWKVSSPCICISEDGHPSPNCNICHGKGSRYTVPSSVENYIKIRGQGSKILKLPDTVKALTFLRVQKDRSGELFTIASQTPSSNIITLGTAATRGDVLRVTYTQNREIEYSGEAIEVSTGVYEITGVIGEITGNATSVTVIDDTGVDPVQYSGISIWGNRVRVDLTAGTTPPTESYETGGITVHCTYAEPLKVLLQGVNPKLEKQFGSMVQNYDALVTIPSTYFMGTGDLLTAIVMEVRGQFVGRTTSTIADIPVFDIGRVLRAYDDSGELTATLIGSNRVEFNRTPTSKYGIVFTYHPTFRLFLDVPQARYAEDKTFATRAMAKRYDSISNADADPQEPVGTGSGLIGRRFGEEVTF